MSQRKQRLIPFSWTPASWGLKGPQRQEAEAAYYYDGYDLDRKLIEIRNPYDEAARAKALLANDHRHGKIDDYTHGVKTLELEGVTGKDHEIALLDLKVAHGLMTEYDRDLAVLELEHPKKGSDRDLAALEIEFKHEKIAQLAYEKDRASILEEPWIGIVDQGFDPDQGLNGVFFEFDWNEYWIIYLRMNGYTGMTDEQIVDMWFSDVCRAQGTNPMQPGFEDGTVIPFNGRVVNRARDDE